MTHAGYDYELEEQRLALADTIAWDAVYACASAQAHATGFAQLIRSTETRRAASRRKVES